MSLKDKFYKISNLYSKFNFDKEIFKNNLFNKNYLISYLNYIHGKKFTCLQDIPKEYQYIINEIFDNLKLTTEQIEHIVKETSDNHFYDSTFLFSIISFSKKQKYINYKHLFDKLDKDNVTFDLIESLGHPISNIYCAGIIDHYNKEISLGKPIENKSFENLYDLIERKLNLNH